MDLLFISKRIYLGIQDAFVNGGIVVDTEGIIRRILRTPQELNTYLYNTESEAVYDFENMILMPGLIDTNVHVNDPGREDWESFATATKAAAAGGYTVIIDRPTYSIPTTTSATNLDIKISAARSKIFIDVGFWGGFVQENLNELKSLCAAGVVGLQCTLCSIPNPIASTEFGAVTKDQVIAGLKLVEKQTLLAFHAELDPIKTSKSSHTLNVDSKTYESFQRTRPAQLEIDAVSLIKDIALQFRDQRFHIMNLSTAEAISSIVECRKLGGHLTAETCPHYLSLCAEEIKDYCTESKTHPPIRSKANQNELWLALKNGNLNSIGSNHSPVTPGLKCLTSGSSRGDFLRAWSGISSLQIAFPVIWTKGASHNIGLQHIYQLMCEKPAQLCGIQQFKGRIEEGYDGDFCIFDPDEEFIVSPEILYSKNKSTPYMNQTLRGVVHATVVRGIHVYQKYEGFGQPLGKVILRKTSNDVVKFVRV